MVFGGSRLLEMFPHLPAEKMAITNNIDQVTACIRANLGRKRMAVLASGDPGFFGIGRYLTDKLGKDNFEIIPNISAMQLAFARIGESWDDAVLASVHSRPIDDIVKLVRQHRKIALFTDNKHTPGEIARLLEDRGIVNCQAYVCQDLGTERETIAATDLYDLKERDFSPLNVTILVRQHDTGARPRLFGIPDDRFHHPEGHSGLMTKLEVRAVSLASLCLREDSVVWDIGAGSGAISVEASRLASDGAVYAVEKDEGAVAAIRENAREFACDNLAVVRAMAPEGLDKLPDPGAVFIGGSGGRMTTILDIACRRLKNGGCIVVNAATLETMQAAISALKANGFDADIALVSVARSRDILDLTRLEALNPVFVITGRRPGHDCE